MSKKLSNKSKIRKILVISLTNIGDVILTFPVIDILRDEYPDAGISLVIGPKARSLFGEDHGFDKIYVFDKHQPALKSLRWIFSMRREKFDLVVDLRNTAIPVMVACRNRTPLRVKKDPKVHMRDKHLARLKSVLDFKNETGSPATIRIGKADGQYVDELIRKKIGDYDKLVIVAPGAADQSKRWPDENFATLCDQLIKDHGVTVVFIGNEDDHKVAMKIKKAMLHEAVDLCGQTTLSQLAELYQHCFFTVVNDSAPLHLASYLDVPTLAIFGPTNPVHYGPWSHKSKFIRKNQTCEACANPDSKLAHSCMKSVNVDDVYRALQIDVAQNRVDFI